MKAILMAVAIAAAAMLGGCSTIISGTSQKITVNTDPTGADCALSRDGLIIGRVNPTPGQTEVSTNRSAITVTCKKEGYQDGSNIDAAGFDPAVLGNILIGGVVGVVVDAASGGASKYDSVVNITLQPLPPGSPPTASGSSSTLSSSTGPAEEQVPAASLAGQRLRSLKQLYDQGAITREEYERRRKAITDGL